MDKDMIKWRKTEKSEAELTENRREEFLEEVEIRPEGVAAEKEKFIMGLKTGSPKVLNPNKKKA
ncbi:MAG: hypothetical protein SCK28_01710 [Bacillota bacterium]|nr:hypothetical protein [Bacillota bacterium]